MNKIAIIGLGYVGLPLARFFATQFVGLASTHDLKQGLKEAVKWYWGMVKQN